MAGTRQGPSAPGATSRGDLRQKSPWLVGQRILRPYGSHPQLSFLILSACWVVLLYWQAIGGPFVYDDIPQIQQNHALLSWHAAAGYLRSSVPFNNEFRGSAGSFYRPLFWLSLGLDRTLWGLNPSGFHVTNLVLHWASGLLGFLLLRAFGVSVLMAGGASLVWLGLPINSEAVAWISGRSFCLMDALMLPALLMADWHLRSRRRWPLLVYSFAFLGALLSHEAGVLVLPLTILVAYARDHKPQRSWLPLGGAAIGVALLYLGLRHLAGARIPAAVLDIGPLGIEFLKYIQWMIFPVAMSVERSTDVPANGFSIPAIVSLLVVLALFIFIVRWRKKMPEVAAGLAWMSVAVLPFCGIVFIYQGMAERYDYVASQGFALAVVALALRARKWARGAIPLLVVLWVGWGAWRLNARVVDWRNEVSLYTSSLRASPRSPVLLYNLGTAYADAGDIERAIRCYRRAIGLKPDYVSALVNLGNLLRARGEYSEAVALYKRAISLDPKSPDPWINLGNIYGQEGSMKDAKSAYERAIALKPDDTQAIINLGVTYQRLGNFAAAKQQYERAISIDRTQPGVYCNLGALLVQEGNADAAIEQFTKAIQIDKSYAAAYFDLGVVYQQTGHNDLATRMYEKALEIKPDYQKARSKLQRLQGRR
jgi:protein O-mannosyl-transferase